MSIFEHHIYEYKKGLRGLVLHTVRKEWTRELEIKLKKKSINYVVHELTDTKCNIFFGDPLCLEVLRQFGNQKLNNLSIEEDFILGIMLGYGQQQQYQRYLMKKKQCGGGQLRQDICCQELQHI